MKLLLPLLALVVLSPVVKAQSHDSAQISKTLDTASGLPDSTKADRFDLFLMADFLHFQYVVYLADTDYAARETSELAALEKDLNAVDAVAFPSIDTGYEKLVTKASSDFKKLYDKDQELQTELHN